MIPTSTILEIVQRGALGDFQKRVLAELLQIVLDDEGLGRDPREWVETFCDTNDIPPAIRADLRKLAQEVVDAGRDNPDPDDE